MKTTNNQQPTTNNQQPTTNNQQPTTNNQQPTTNNQHPTTNNQQPTLETSYLNLLRVLATFAVIMIHVFAPINTYFSASLTNLESYICVILKNLWQWCVPIFVMISGVLFLNPQKEITLEKIIKKYFTRIILAIIIFGIPYAFMEIFFDSNLTFNIKQIGIAMFNAMQGNSWSHMWYLYMIAGLYLCIPIFKIFVNNAQKSVIEYTLVLLFIFTSIIPSLESVFPFKFGIYLPINSVYVFYLLLGYYIHYNKVTIKNKILMALLVFYILFIILISLDKKFVTLSEGGAIILSGYNSPIVVMVTFVIFCIMHQNRISYKIVENIVPMCFGIYLIHTLFINYLYKFIKLTPEKYPLIIVVILTSIITILLSISFCYLARKIKIVKKYIL
jgi:surface polysaccharide O-acyltransferase-like enzyme